MACLRVIGLRVVKRWSLVIKPIKNKWYHSGWLDGHNTQAQHKEKEQELAACPNGVIGLETSLGVVLSIKKIPFDRAIDAMTAAPARILGLQGKGVLKAGADADLTLIDPKATWTVDPAAFKSKGRCTPYEKMKLTGRAVHVIVGGRVCF